MARIAILHPGEMGAAIGGALAEIGHDVGWLPGGRSLATERRASRAGLRPLDDVIGCDLVVSVCPPGAAVGVARSIPGYRGLFVDANAIAPITAEAIAAEVTTAGMTYVDGGVIGPPPTGPGSTRLYLSGTAAPAVADLFAGARIEARAIMDAGPVAASGLKMVYSAWSKISSALLLAADGAAGGLGLGAALHAEWQLSQPDLAERLARARAAATAKGWRWEAEMREIAATLAAADQPAGFGLAAADVFACFDRPRPVS